MVAVEAAAKKEIMIIILVIFVLIIKTVVGYFGLEASKILTALSCNRNIWL